MLGAGHYDLLPSLLFYLFFYPAHEKMHHMVNGDPNLYNCCQKFGGPYIAILELFRPFDHRMTPRKFLDDISQRLRR